jgi:hypothetical protein
MDILHPFSTPHDPRHSHDQVIEYTQKRFQRKMRSFERLKEVYSEGIRTLRIIGHIRPSQIASKENNPRGPVREFVQDSFPGPRVPSSSLSDDKIACDRNNDRLEPCFLKEPTFNEQTGSAHGLRTTLDFYQEFFNNRPLMRCLDTEEDEDLTDKVYERLLEESRRYIGQSLSVRLDSLPDDADTLYAMLLKETTTQVGGCSLPEPSRHEMNVTAWWDNVRAQLRDEDEPA